MSTSSLKSMSFSCGLLATLATLATFTAPAARAIDIAGSLEVNLNANTFTTGTPWANSGAFGGLFSPVGTPKRETVLGAPAVMLDGSDALRSSFAVTTLAGGNSRSVEVWAWQAAVRNEETMVAWGRRGGPDATNDSYNWGASREWGAHGGWGSNADVGWNPVAGNNPGDAPDLTGAPSLGSWHHLVYTYNSATTALTFYDNGVLRNSQALNAYGSGALALNTYSGYNMLIGSQNDQTNTALPGANTGDNIGFSGAIGQVRVHSGVLTPTNVANNYALEAGNYSGALTGTPLTAGPANRYTFNNLSGGANGTIVTDVVGGMNATIRGAGAAPSGTSGIDLPGGGSATQAYIDLPNGLVSSRTNITLEAWVTTQSTQNWARIIDIGSGSAGELAGPGGGASGGTNYLMVTASDGTSNNQRLERRGAAIPAGSVNGIDNRETYLSVNNGIEQYVAITFDDAADEWRYYRNGVLMEIIPDTNALSALPDVNAWLGRSQYDGDANLDGIYNEFRISDYALDGSQIYGNFLAGPNVVNVVPEPTTAATLALIAGALATRRRRSR